MYLDTVTGILDAVNRFKISFKISVLSDTSNTLPLSTFEFFCAINCALFKRRAVNWMFFCLYFRYFHRF